MCVQINNEIYHELKEKWYESDNNPIALLRIESKVKIKYIVEKINEKYGNAKVKILDVGCGAGFISNELALQGHQVTGLDVSAESLEIAKLYDKTGQVNYIVGDAYNLNLPLESYDIVIALDFLEHVDDPKKTIEEMSKVLKKDGLCFFHTFNRNILSWFVIIKMVEWLVPNTPKNLHLLNLFIKPKELKEYCAENSIAEVETIGIKANVFSRAVVKGVFQRKVPKDFSFSLTKSTLLSYMMYGSKN